MLNNSNTLRDVSEAWPERLAKVRASQARTDTSDMSRSPRDPAEREFLEKRGQMGPFREKGSD